jgi:hypothetical protein
MVALPVESSEPSPRKTGPRVAVTDPVGTGPAVVGPATTTVKVTGDAKTEGFALEVPVMVTAPAVVDCARKGNSAANRTRTANGAASERLK